MIETLYPPFRKWTEKGALWIYSDPHFSDPDMAELRKNYIGDDEQVARINSKVGKNDTIIFLGDIGNEEMIRKIRGRKILIMGNHDKGASKYQRQIVQSTCDADRYTKEEIYNEVSKKYPGWTVDIREGYCVNSAPYSLWLVRVDNCLFDEVYEGPLFIAEKLILSHEPVNLPFAFNIHGHDHSNWYKGERELNVCAEHIDYTPVNVNRLIKKGLLSKVESIHRMTIDRAVEKKNKITNGRYALSENRCGCTRCVTCRQRKKNHDETGWHCISFGFVDRIIKNILECEDSLSSTQRDAMQVTVETIEGLEKSLTEE